MFHQKWIVCCTLYIFHSSSLPPTCYRNFRFVHSNLKFRVSVTEAFRKTTFTKYSSSKVLPETSGFQTETSGFRTETTGFRTETSGFRTETSGFSTETSCFWKPKFRVFEPKLFVLQRFFLSHRNFVCWFRDFLRNFGISNPYEVSVERKPEKFSKFQAKMNYCVQEGWNQYKILIEIDL
jgi:hypothetical protein